MAILVDNFSGTPLEAKGLTVLLDYAGRTDGQPVYVGCADPTEDKTTADAVWKIMKLEYDGNDQVISRKWADGDTLFNNVWDDRAALSYF